MEITERMVEEVTILELKGTLTIDDGARFVPKRTYIRIPACQHGQEERMPCLSPQSYAARYADR